MEDINNKQEVVENEDDMKVNGLELSVNIFNDRDDIGKLRMFVDVFEKLAYYIEIDEDKNDNDNYDNSVYKLDSNLVENNVESLVYFIDRVFVAAKKNETDNEIIAESLQLFGQFFSVKENNHDPYYDGEDEDEDDGDPYYDDVDPYYDGEDDDDDEDDDNGDHNVDLTNIKCPNCEGKFDEDEDIRYLYYENNPEDSDAKTDEFEDIKKMWYYAHPDEVVLDNNNKK